MEKQRVEIIKESVTEAHFGIIKREKWMDLRSLGFICAVIFALVLILWYTPTTAMKQDGLVRALIGSIGVAILLMLVASVYRIRFHLSLDVKNRKLQSWYSFLSVTLARHDYNIENVKQLSLARFGIAANYLDGDTIRRRLGIFHKYAIYAIYANDEYDRIVGFNNYVEARRVLDNMEKLTASRAVDGTQVEFADEDMFISNYIRYRDLAKQVKSE